MPKVRYFIMCPRSKKTKKKEGHASGTRDMKGNIVRGDHLHSDWSRSKKLWVACPGYMPQKAPKSCNIGLAMFLLQLAT